VPGITVDEFKRKKILKDLEAPVFEAPHEAPIEQAKVQMSIQPVLD
jgi:hypothetical protein